MARTLDQIIVVDIEATCWEGDPPPGEENEIIEIGFCLLDPVSLERSERTCYLVKPERSKVSEFCTKLTTLTQTQVDGGMSFREACALLKNKFQGKDRLWASYGDYDRAQFERQCKGRTIGYPFGPSHLNIKSMFALLYGLPREVGMAEALSRAGVTLEGTHHRGVDDAWNTAGILARLLQASRQGLPPLLPPHPG